MLEDRLSFDMDEYTRNGSSKNMLLSKKNGIRYVSVEGMIWSSNVRASPRSALPEILG